MFVTMTSLKLTEKYVPHMKEWGYGLSVMIGSVNQYKQNPQGMVYAAAKSAQMNFMHHDGNEVILQL